MKVFIYGMAFFLSSSQVVFGAKLIHIEDDLAKFVFDNFKVKAEHDGAYHTTKKAEGQLVCAERDVSNTPLVYWCRLLKQDLLELKGETAKSVYEHFAVTGEHDGGYHTFKKATGTLTCVVRSPFNAPSKYWCTFAE